MSLFSLLQKNPTALANGGVYVGYFRGWLNPALLHTAKAEGKEGWDADRLMLVLQGMMVADQDDVFTPLPDIPEQDKNKAFSFQRAYLTLAVKDPLVVTLDRHYKGETWRKIRDMIKTQALADSRPCIAWVVPEHLTDNYFCSHIELLEPEQMFVEIDTTDMEVAYF